MPPKHPQMTITDFNYDSSYLPGLTCNMDVRAYIGRSTGRFTPHTAISWSRMAILLLRVHLGQEWQFDISTVRAHTGR